MSSLMSYALGALGILRPHDALAMGGGDAAVVEKWFDDEPAEKDAALAAARTHGDRVTVSGPQTIALPVIPPIRPSRNPNPRRPGRAQGTAGSVSGLSAAIDAIILAEAPFYRREAVAARLNAERGAVEKTDLAAEIDRIILADTPADRRDMAAARLCSHRPNTSGLAAAIEALSTQEISS